jgi:hypothetical protein
MVDTVKISDLNTIQTIADEDLFVVVDKTGPYSNAITRANLVASLATEFVRGDSVNNGSTFIIVDDADFAVQDTTDAPGNFIWRDYSESKLLLGTANAVITPRSDIIPDNNDTRDLGSPSKYFARAYIDNGFFGSDTGIGTETPSYRLDVVETSGTVARFKNGDSGGTPSNTHGELVVESDGDNLGIQILGTDTSDQRLLFSNTTSAGKAAIVYNHSGDYMRFRVNESDAVSITSDGDIGIGTTSPTQALQVERSGATIAGIRAVNTTGNSALFLSSQNTGTGTLFFGDTDSFQSGYIEYNHTPDSMNLRSTGNVRFETGGANERMRIDSTGDIGIGTQTPAYRLDVVDTTSGIVARFKNGDSGGTPSGTHGELVVESDGGNLGIQILGTDTSDQRILFGNTTSSSKAAVVYNHSGDYMRFRVNSSDVVHIESDGKVGIGTTSPETQLDVQINDSTAYTSSHSGADNYTPLATDAIQIKNTDSTGAPVGIHFDGGGVSGYTGQRVAKIEAVGELNNHGTAITFKNRTAVSGTTSEKFRIDSLGNMLIGTPTTPTSSEGNIVLKNGVAPTGSATDGIILYAEDVSSSSELKVRDEAGNITTLSPHNFDLIPEGPSEDLAWSYYSERDGKRINVDMLKALRVLEKLSGQKLVYEG